MKPSHYILFGIDRAAVDNVKQYGSISHDYIVNSSMYSIHKWLAAHGISSMKVAVDVTEVGVELRFDNNEHLVLWCLTMNNNVNWWKLRKDS